MERFHLQAMRKLVRWDTTFINRDNTNEKIYEEINGRLGKHEDITLAEK